MSRGVRCIHGRREVMVSQDYSYDLCESGGYHFTFVTSEPIHSFYKGLLNTSFEPGSVLSFGIIPANKIQRIPAVVELCYRERGQTTKGKLNMYVR